MSPHAAPRFLSAWTILALAAYVAAETDGRQMRASQAAGACGSSAGMRLFTPLTQDG
jgi:hypothetical protein